MSIYKINDSKGIDQLFDKWDETMEQRDASAKNKSFIRKMLLFTLFLSSLFVMILPMITTIITSVSSYSLQHEVLYKAIVRDYQYLFKTDQYFIKNILYTIVITLISVTTTVGISFFFAKLSGILSTHFKVLLSIFFMTVSVTSIAPIGMNNLLDLTGMPLEAIYTNQLSSCLLMILLTFLLGIGPLYLLFIISYILKDRKNKYLHIAVSFQIAVCYIVNYSMAELSDFRPMERGLDLASRLNSIIYIRGTGEEKIMVITGCVMLVLFMILNSLLRIYIWLYDRIFIRKSDVPKGESKDVFSGKLESKKKKAGVLIILIIMAGICLSPFLFCITHLWQQSINWNGKVPDQYLRTALVNSIMVLMESVLISFLFLFISGYALSRLSDGIYKKILLPIAFVFILSSTIYLYAGQREVVSNFDILINSALICFKGIFFGVGIFLSPKLFHINFGEEILYIEERELKNRISSYLSALLSLSLLASLTVWFQQDYCSSYFDMLSPYNERLLLYQLYQHFDYMGDRSNLLVISMIIPIALIAISVPLLLNSLEQKNQKDQERS